MLLAQRRYLRAHLSAIGLHFRAQNHGPGQGPRQARREQICSRRVDARPHSLATPAALTGLLWRTRGKPTTRRGSVRVLQERGSRAEPGNELRRGGQCIQVSANRIICPSSGPSRPPTRRALARVAATMMRPRRRLLAVLACRDTTAHRLSTPSDDVSRIRARPLDNVGMPACIGTPRCAGGLHTRRLTARSELARIAEATARPRGSSTATASATICNTPQVCTRGWGPAAQGGEPRGLRGRV